MTNSARRLASLLGLLSLGFAAPARGGEAPAGAAAGLPDRLAVDTLENGLQVVVEERHASPIVHVRALMRIGGIYEGEYLGCGLSHWMEHIVAGGSTRRTEVGPDGVARTVGRTEEETKDLVKSLGGNRNAMTSLDFTCYYITTEASRVGTALDLVSDWLQHCQFDPVEVAREQRVVQQELLRNLDDPQRFRGQLFVETALRVHPARVPVIGYQDAIQRVTREDMTTFYARHYTPQNCVVSVVGDVDKEEALALVRRYFGAWKRKPLAPYVLPEEPEQTAPRWVEKAHGSTRTCLVTMGVPTIPLLHPDLYALDMLAYVLGGAQSARLPRTFEHDPSRKVHASRVGASNYTPHFGAGRFVVGFGADTVEEARALVEEIWAQVEAMKETLVAPEEIARAVRVVEKSVLSGRTDLGDRAQALAHDVAWLSDPLFTDRYLERLATVTPEQVREAARRWIRGDRRTVAIVTPPAPAQEVAAPQAREAEGAVRKVVLENGLTVLLKRVPDYGMVDAVATFHGGVIHEDEATSGLFLLMASTFWRGTQALPLRAMAQRMDELGMSLSSESQNNAFTVTMQALASEFAPSFELYTDVLRRPAIDAAWVEQGKRHLLERVLPNLAVNANEQANRVVRETLYTEGPYRRQRYGTPETLKTFDAAKVRALYETYLRPNNGVLALYGDFDLEAAEALVRARLGDWARGEIPASHARADAGPKAPRVVELENRQIRTNYVLAWRAYARQQEAERAPLAVANAILGSSGWLHSRLREGKADYVYAVGAMPFQGDQAGHFVIQTDFEPKDEAIVLGIVDGAVADLVAGKFTDEELTIAKQMIQCWDAMGKESNAAVASSDAISELFGQGYDSDAAYFAKVRAVTREDVIRVAKEVFSRPSLRVLVRPSASEPSSGAVR